MINNGIEIRFNTWNYIDINPVTGQTSVEWIFAGGDAVTGPASVVEAVAHGEKAAVGIDQYLTGEKHAFWREDKQLDTFFDPDADPVDTPRARIRMIPIEQRQHNFSEVELSWKAPVALREASRCLRCEYREEASAA
jgi:NADH-quinone oxidoreductase subunit F